MMLVLQATVWDALSAVAPVLAPVLSLFLTLLFLGWWNHEGRMRDLEQSDTRQRRTMYGDPDDPQQTGLASDVNEIIRKVDNLVDRVTELEQQVEN